MMSSAGNMTLYSSDFVVLVVVNQSHEKCREMKLKKTYLKRFGRLGVYWGEGEDKASGWVRAAAL